MKYFLCFVILIVLLVFINKQCTRGDGNVETVQIEYTDSKFTENSSFETKSHAKANRDSISTNKNEREYTLSIKTIVSTSSSCPSILLQRTGYTASYNPDTRCPNWVAWILTRERLEGNASRDGVPYYDEDGRGIGIGVLTNETTKSGYIVDTHVDSPRPELDDYKDAAQLYNLSHGHMCPAGDNKWSKEAMNQSFLLTNMCPQDAKLNNGAWNKLEEKCRNLSRKYGELYIVTGPVFYDGVGRTIGENRIAVPDAFFKVLLRNMEEPKSIGFVYPNDSGSYGWERCACSVDDVEKLTGFDFFPELADSIENEIESICVTEEWK